MKGRRGGIKRNNHDNNEPEAKARVSLETEIENSKKIKQANRQKKKEKPEDEVDEEILKKDEKKIINSAYQQLKDEKKSMDEEKEDVEQTINKMEEDGQLNVLDDMSESSDSELDSEDNDENKDKEYDVQVDNEALKLLDAFKDNVEVVDVNKMINKQVNKIIKEEKKAEPTKTVRVINPKVTSVFKQLGEFLSHYRIGKLPKVFKLLPSFEEWIELLQITDPSKWTPQALFAATKMFIHTSQSMSLQFITIFLMPIIRHSLHEKKKLHFQEYLAVKRCIFHPASFFKGIVFPLCESNDLTFKEAMVIASIVQKVSIPAKHSAVALYKLSSMQYNSTQGLFMKVLLDKKYSLPYQALDNVVNYFITFTDRKEQLPLLWHQSLLVLVQRYSKDFKPEQTKKLLRLCQVQKHHAITDIVVATLQKKRD